MIQNPKVGLNCYALCKYSSGQQRVYPVKIIQVSKYYVQVFWRTWMVKHKKEWISINRLYTTKEPVIDFIVSSDTQLNRRGSLEYYNDSYFIVELENSDKNQ